MSVVASASTSASRTHAREIEKDEEEKEDPVAWRVCPARERKVAGSDFSARLHRAKLQRMYMIDGQRVSQFCWKFAVLGSTGNVYTVQVGPKPSCDCPDAAQGFHCKHIILIFLKVLKRPETDNLIYQKGLTKYELLELFSRIPRNLSQGSDSIIANKAVRSAFDDSRRKEQNEEQVGDQTPNVKQKPLDGNECLICFEDFIGSTTEAVLWCKTQCGYNFHKECFAKWEKAKGQAVTCPSCRTAWQGAKPLPKMQKRSYQNFANLQSDLAQNNNLTSADLEYHSHYYSHYSGRRRRYY